MEIDVWLRMLLFTLSNVILTKEDYLEDDTRPIDRRGYHGYYDYLRTRQSPMFGNPASGLLSGNNYWDRLDSGGTAFSANQREDLIPQMDLDQLLDYLEGGILDPRGLGSRFPSEPSGPKELSLLTEILQDPNQLSVLAGLLQDRSDHPSGSGRYLSSTHKNGSLSEQQRKRVDMRHNGLGPSGHYDQYDGGQRSFMTTNKRRLSQEVGRSPTASVKDSARMSGLAIMPKTSYHHSISRKRGPHLTSSASLLDQTPVQIYQQESVVDQRYGGNLFSRRPTHLSYRSRNSGRNFVSLINLGIDTFQSKVV